jgi:hypothetical protein
MRKAITIDLTETDRLALSAIVRDRNSPQKHVWRAQIAYSADPDQPFRPIVIMVFTLPEEGAVNSMTWCRTATTDG